MSQVKANSEQDNPAPTFVQPSSNNLDPHAWAVINHLSTVEANKQSWLVICKGMKVLKQMESMLWAFNGSSNWHIEVMSASDGYMVSRKHVEAFEKNQPAILLILHGMIISGGFRIQMKHPFSIAATYPMAKADAARILNLFFSSEIKPTECFLSMRGV